MTASLDTPEATQREEHVMAEWPQSTGIALPRLHWHQPERAGEMVDSQGAFVEGSGRPVWVQSLVWCHPVVQATAEVGILPELFGGRSEGWEGEGCGWDGAGRDLGSLKFCKRS